MQDYYNSWEWQPLENMPDGCNEVTVEFDDGSRREMCSCDYWWSISQKRFKQEPIKFRYD